MGMAYDSEELYRQQLKKQYGSEMTQLKRELTAARGEAAEARSERDSCKDAEVVAWAEVDKLRGRVSAQSDALYECAVALKDAGNLSRELHNLIISATEGSDETWLLRKQAEAVEKFAECLSGTRNKRLASSEANGLRFKASLIEQQADAIQKGERDE